jgi:hypothetical protein
VVVRTVESRLAGRNAAAPPIAAGGNEIAQNPEQEHGFKMLKWLGMDRDYPSKIDERPRMRFVTRLPA